jgi:2-amino-4-hydroxy-6-hydroxymethyldihydropteridine diphosphokinase
MVEPAPTVAALVGLGSNVEAERNLPAAVRLLASRLPVCRVSSAWETPAVGPVGQPPFLNAAALVDTALAVRELKPLLRGIEQSLGRVRGPDRFAPRTIDLDLVLYPVAHSPRGEGFQADPDLLREAYLAVPAAEVLPDWVHPATGEPLARLATRLVAALPLELRPRRVELGLEPRALSGR